MTVEVHYLRNGEYRTEELSSEQAASVFMDGLEQRPNHKFKKITYPEKEDQNHWQERSRRY